VGCRPAQGSPGRHTGSGPAGQGETGDAGGLVCAGSSSPLPEIERPCKLVWSSRFKKATAAGNRTSYRQIRMRSRSTSACDSGGGEVGVMPCPGRMLALLQKLSEDEGDLGSSCYAANSNS
jgi:hypothetical protein